MGVPKFFRWLSERYPLINEVIDSKTLVPPVDNFYVDVNGIIYNYLTGISMTEDLDIHSSLVVSVLGFIDQMFSLVRPKKLFYIAIDGVAPRAKLNQQRQRRFAAARDRQEGSFDTTTITPGTKFMATFSRHVRAYVASKISNDVLWKDVQVIFSGIEVPGEGEHKIVEYIRHQKCQPEWDPNTVHCLYGPDADLVFLALATHEPHFMLLRPGGNSSSSRKVYKSGDAMEFTLVHISLVREYLIEEFTGDHDSKFFCQENYEKIVDDFVLLCILFGNDFIPSLPDKDISDGSLDKVMKLYTKIVPELGGFIMEDGCPVPERLAKLFTILGQVHDITESDNNAGGAPAVEVKVEGSEKKNNDAAQEVQAKPAKSPEEKRKDYYESRFGWDVNSEEGAKNLRQLQLDYVEALYWICHYYYHGCQSWAWFYPHHFVALTTDLPLEFDVPKFSLSKPLSPLQQLLAVLPPKSGYLLPKSFAELMQSPELKEYYDVDSFIEREGEVVLPFIDVSKLIALTEKATEGLTEDEKVRNILKDADVFEYDANSSEVLASTIPEIFPSGKKSVLVLPNEPKDGPPSFCLLKGTKMGLENPPGLPTFQSLKVRSKLAHCNVSKFGLSKESLCLTLNGEGCCSLENPEVGSNCWIWPHNNEALITRVRVMDPENNTTKEGLVKHWMKHKAIKIHNASIVVTVKRFEGYLRVPNENGKDSLVKKYSCVEEHFPLQMLLASPPNPSKEHLLDEIPEVLPNQLFVSTESSSFGALCLVTEPSQGDSVKVQILRRAEYPEKLIPIILLEQYASLINEQIE